MLGGCSGENSTGKVELRYMAWGNPQQLALEERLVEEFNSSNPDVHVRLFKVPQSSYGNKMIVMLASRTAPDIMRVDHFNFPSLVKKDYFRPLDDLIAKDREFRLSDFFTQAIDEGRHKGKLYGLNVLFGSVLVYYNKTLVQKCGLEDPYALWQRGEWTWERYRSHAITMTKQRSDGKYETFGASVPGIPMQWLAVWGFGGEIMDAEMKRVRLNEPPAVAAYTFWRDLRSKDKAAPTPSQAANSVFSFESGKIGMQFDWMGMTPRGRETVRGFDWDVVPIPGGASLLKGNQLVMNADSAHPEASWRFMKHMTSEKVERILAVEMRRAFPTRKAIAYSKEYLGSDQAPRNMNAFVYAVETGRPLPITDRWNDWVWQFNGAIDLLLSGQETNVQAACDDGVERATKALAVPEGL